MTVAFNTFMSEMGPIFPDTLWEIVKSQNTFDIYQEIIQSKKPFTAFTLMNATFIPEASVYRAMNKLRDLGLIEPLTKVQRSLNGGPRVTVWELVQ